MTGWPGDKGGGREGQLRPGECHRAQESECPGAQGREGKGPEKSPLGLVTGNLTSLQGAMSVGGGAGTAQKALSSRPSLLALCPVCLTIIQLLEGPDPGEGFTESFSAQTSCSDLRVVEVGWDSGAPQHYPLILHTVLNSVRKPDLFQEAESPQVLGAGTTAP